EPRLVYAIEVVTGINRHGLLERGEMQVSPDGSNFTSVAALKDGAAKAVLTDNHVRAIRLRASTEQAEPMVVREINLRLMVELAGAISNPAAAIGEGNVGMLKADTEFRDPIGTCAAAIINRDFRLALNSAGVPAKYSGPISGSGNVDCDASRHDAR